MQQGLQSMRERQGFFFDRFQRVQSTSRKKTISQRIILMSLLQKKEVRLTLGAVGLGAFFFGLFKIYKYLGETNHPPSLLTSNYDDPMDEEAEPPSLIGKSQQHVPYDNLIEDSSREKLVASRITALEYLRDINYRLILSLMKGNSYQGIVNISFWLQHLPESQIFLPLNYNGGGIKYLAVNGRAIEYTQVRYNKHIIEIPRGLLAQNGRNNIQVIFQSLYSFLNCGLSTYFMVDEHRKYSLRQQVIYSTSGFLEAQRLMPCFNCMNQCQIRLEVIHPDTFEVFSNSAKSLERLCSANQYPKYPFLFDLASSSLNKSFKLNQSTISSCSAIGQSTMSMSYSTTQYFQRKKANTHFYKQKLPSIHHLFLFCSSMIQLQPTYAHSQIQSELLVRYFCKPTESHRFIRSVNKLHSYIIDLFRRLHSENIKDHINKIDILIVADADIEGTFAPGVILLSEQSLDQSHLEIRCMYLVVRALLGLLNLQKGHNTLTTRETLELNQQVYDKFQEFRNYLFIKNCKFDKIRKIIGKQKGLLQRYEGYFMKYYKKELKFLLRQNSQQRITFQLKALMLSFKAQTSEEFWQNFISNYNFLSPLIVEPLVKLGLRNLPFPTKPKLLQQLKSTFNNSKYSLSFYRNDQIGEELPRFINQQSYGLQQRLPQIKVKQKFKDFITEQYEKYLPIRSNTTQAQSMYLQFKRFSESKNFHHIQVLKAQIKRISYFGSKFVTPERLDLQCSIAGWRLLEKIQIYPADQEYYQLLRELRGDDSK